MALIHVPHSHSQSLDCTTLKPLYPRYKTELKLESYIHIYPLTLPVSLMDLKIQKYTNTQDSSNVPTSSHLIEPISLMELVICSTRLLQNEQSLEPWYCFTPVGTAKGWVLEGKHPNSQINKRPHALQTLDILWKCTKT